MFVLDGGIYMEIGESITLHFDNSPHKKEKEKYLSKIIDMDEQFLYVNNPRNQPTSMLKEIGEVTVDYVQNGVPYKFKSQIVKHVELTVPALVIKIPAREDIKKIQRREFVRIQTDVDVALHFPNSSTSPIVSVTYDISGGGASVIVPPKTEISDEQHVAVYFVLHSSSIDYEYIQADAEIIRFHTFEKVNTVSLKFLFISDRDQQKIINYCFDKQREKRKQELI